MLKYIIMFKTISSLLLIALITTACQRPSHPNATPPRQHLQTSQEIESIMHKFNNLIFQNFHSELERDEKRIIYTQEMASLLDELVANTKELQNYSQQHSIEYVQFANALEKETQKLRTNIVNYQTEAIEPTLTSITNICNQCHATLQ